MAQVVTRDQSAELVDFSTSGAYTPVMPPLEPGQDLTPAESKEMVKGVETALQYHREAKALTDLDFALTEEEVAEKLMSEADLNIITGRKDPNPIMSSSMVESVLFDDNVAFFLAFIPLLCILIPLFSFDGYLAALVIQGLLFGSKWIVSEVLGYTNPYVTFRNKVIMRKRFKREVRRITAQNKVNRERNAWLRRNQQRHLDIARSTTASLAKHYEKHNPGMTLKLSKDLTTVTEVAKPVEVTQAPNRKTLPQRIAGVERQEIVA